MYNKIRDFFLQFTPLGKADLEVKGNLKGEQDQKQLERYETTLKRYRDLKLMETGFRILLYASIITAVATTFGFDQIMIIQRIASYLGTTLTLIMYLITKYFTMIAKENYHVQREILISQNN